MCSMPQDSQSTLARGPVVDDAGVGGYVISRETVQLAQLVTSEVVKCRYGFLHPRACAEFFIADLGKMVPCFYHLRTKQDCRLKTGPAS